jgi:bifunctional aspartokinase / homoserine dehydrogenase 1
MKILKFGGKSLSNGEGLEKSLPIIRKHFKEGPVVLVASARGKATDELEDLLEKAAKGRSYFAPLSTFFKEQAQPAPQLNLQAERKRLEELLQGVQLLGEYSPRIKAEVLAYGELIAVKTLSHIFALEGIKAQAIDARNLLETFEEDDDSYINWNVSKRKVTDYFENYDFTTLPIVTGFISRDSKGNTSNLGRNGSNYTATLLANFLDASEVLNYTNVNGVYSANPTVVKGARIIPELTYREANELANFGTNVLHAKTIVPLIEKEIPFRILNSFDATKPGTVVNAVGKGQGKGIKAVSYIENVALVSIEGGGLLGKVGIDARIFTALSHLQISVRNISQASSERGVGFVIDKSDISKAKQALHKEFKKELLNQDITKIDFNEDVAVISIIGRHNYSLEKAIEGLRKNAIWLYLINNTINGEHISLVVSGKNLKKAVNVVHNQVFGAVKKLNVVALGKGTVGKAFIEQVLSSRDKIKARKNLDIRIVAVADSKKLLFQPNGIKEDWANKLNQSEYANSLPVLFQLLEENHLENVVIIDNTASESVTANYPLFADFGADIIASNKIANTIDYTFYAELRKKLRQKSKDFLYETNVGAGLPLLDTIKQLHLSGDKIRKIRGIFSGSLSYIFNNYSVSPLNFSDILKEAIQKGYTEPDPRIDLSGKDVARKVLILARELDYQKELSDVHIESLIPSEFNEEWSVAEFLAQEKQLDKHYENIKKTLSADEALRYVGEFSEDGQLTVQLIKVSKQSPLGNLSGADSIFEIYTETYGEKPMVIQGAGAGAGVTARGVYSDLLRIGNKL